MNEKRIVKYIKSCVHFYGVLSIQEIINTIKHYEYGEPTRKEVQHVLQRIITPRTTIQLIHNVVYNKEIVIEDNVMQLYKKFNTKEFYYPQTVELLFRYEVSTFYEETQGCGYFFEIMYEALIEYLEPAKEAHYFIAKTIQSFRLGHSTEALIDHLKKDDDFTYIFLDEKRYNHLKYIMDLMHDNSRLYRLRGATINEIEHR